MRLDPFSKEEMVRIILQRQEGQPSPRTLHRARITLSQIAGAQQSWKETRDSLNPLLFVEWGVRPLLGKCKELQESGNKAKYPPKPSTLPKVVYKLRHPATVYRHLKLICRGMAAAQRQTQQHCTANSQEQPEGCPCWLWNCSHRCITHNSRV